MTPWNPLKVACDSSSRFEASVVRKAQRTIFIKAKLLYSVGQKQLAARLFQSINRTVVSELVTVRNITTIQSHSLTSAHESPRWSYVIRSWTGATPLGRIEWRCCKRVLTQSFLPVMKAS